MSLKEEDQPDVEAPPPGRVTGEERQAGGLGKSEEVPESEDTVALLHEHGEADGGELPPMSQNCSPERGTI